VEIRATPPDNPRSSAVNYDRPAPISHEEEILELMKAGNAVIAPRSKLILGKYECDRDEIIADLVDFEVYRCLASGQRYHSELIGLNLFDVKAKDVYFDGYVVANNTRYYVERIKVEDISIGGYGSDSDPSITTYIQTPLAAKDHTSDIWLRLRQPAERYERFHTPFLWIAMLSKYAIDYMDDQPNGTVSLQSFKNSFHSWLSQRFGWNGRVQKWLAMFENKIDFRVAFHAYKDFLYNQALNLSTSQHLASHPVWSQCMCSRLVTIEQRPTLLNYTIATAHVYENFKNMYFARKLRQVPLSASVDQLRRKRSLRLGFSEDGLPPTTIRHRHNDTAESLSVKVGDVVSIIPDDADGIRWRTSGTEWLAYIQGIEPIASGAHRLMVLWLYRPADTNICLANYPITREIFLSDNCNCEERDLLSTDVLRKHTVEWKPKSLITTKDFLIRQTYATSDSAFVTLKDDHKVCPCRKPKPDLVKWCAGDTVYVTKMVAGLKILEPVVIQDIDQKSNTARVRLLLRLARDCSGLSIQAGRNNILPNELVLTGKLKTFSLLRIQRACYVRFVQKTDIINNHVPSPYNLGGVGDFWFISMGLESTNEDKQLIFLERLPRGFHEAQEERLPYAKLRGLSLFSGGGGLDRGIEAAGAVEFDTSVDYDPAAIHTQRANCKDPQSMRLFCGSVDDYLNAAFSGDRDRSIARVGEVDMIAAGSPCPGMLHLYHMS
jgi:DNA (cytosine-5)-methyltransferase 1